MIYQQIGDQLNEDQPWIWMWSISDTYVFNRRVNIPFLTAPTGANPKTIAEVPTTTAAVALPTWYYRIENWTIKA